MEDVESILGKHFDYVLPNDFQTAQESIRTGVPCILGSRHTLLAQGMASMVDGYVHPENEARDSRGDNSGSGWLSRIFS